MANEFIKMKNDSKEARKAQLDSLPANVTHIGTSFKLPEGVHQLLVADKDAFGILIVEGTRGANAGKKFSLNLVAGTITTAAGETVTIENSDKPGAKTLAFPDPMFLDMQCNADYDITINERGYVVSVSIAAEVEEEPTPAPVKSKGRSRVTA